MDHPPRPRDDVLLVRVEQPAERAGRTRSRPAVSAAASPRIATRGLLHRRRCATDEVGDRRAADEDGVDAGPLEREHVVAGRRREVGDRELAGRDVGQQVEDAVEIVLVVLGVARREQENLGVDPIERRRSSESSSWTSATISSPRPLARACSASRCSSSSWSSTTTRHASAPASCAASSDASTRNRIGSPLASRIPDAIARTARASAPCSSAACADSASPTSAMIEIPSPSEMAWLRRRPPVTGPMLLRCRSGARRSSARGRRRSPRGSARWRCRGRRV